MSELLAGPLPIRTHCRNDHRRVALAVLAEEDRTLTLSDLTRSIVGHTEPEPITEVAGDVVTDVQRDLHHVHLPTLDGDALVQYDGDRQLASPAPRLVEVRSQIDDAVAGDGRLDAPLQL